MPVFARHRTETSDFPTKWLSIKESHHADHVLLDRRGGPQRDFPGPY